MASILPVIAALDENDIKTISFGQSIKLDCRTLSRRIAIDGAGFSGELTLQAAGSGMNEHFSLDAGDGVISLTCHATSFYTETRVHIGGACIGSYVDLGVGPYFNIGLRNASLQHLDVLLQSIRFTTVSNAFSPGHAGPRIITVELRDNCMSKPAAAMQDIVEVLSCRPLRQAVAVWQGQTGFAGLLAMRSRGDFSTLHTKGLSGNPELKT